jgi:hypothetical protein
MAQLFSDYRGLKVTKQRQGGRLAAHS